jgi:hypothetical protein
MAMTFEFLKTRIQSQKRIIAAVRHFATAIVRELYETHAGLVMTSA